MGGNTPIEFLLEESGIELKTLYVIPGIELPAPLPDHDVAVGGASQFQERRDTPWILDSIAARWPRPMFHPPRLALKLHRHNLHRPLPRLDGLDFPSTQSG